MLPNDVFALSTIASTPRKHLHLRGQELLDGIEEPAAQRIAEVLLAEPEQRHQFPAEAQRAAEAIEKQVGDVDRRIERFRSRGSR